MQLVTQQYLRMLIPGLFLYGLLVVFCWTTRWCQLSIPHSYEEGSKLVASVVLGFIYSATPLRKMSNAFYHTEVNSQIVALLTKPFKSEIPGIELLTWNEIRTVFYHFVDKDKSLETQSQMARFNGLLWTSAADLRVVSLAGIPIFAAAMICSSRIASLKFEEATAGLPILGLFMVFLSSLYASQYFTGQHRLIGRQQFDYILHHYSEELKGMFKTFVARNTSQNG